MSDILKKAVNEIENIKKGVKKQLAKEIIAENKKEINDKISKLLENDIEATETPVENTDEKEFNVDFIDTILDDIDIESILTDTEGNEPTIDTTDEVEPIENKLTDEIKLDEKMTDKVIDTQDKKEPMSDDAILAKIKELVNSTEVTPEEESMEIPDMEDEELEALIKEMAAEMEAPIIENSDYDDDKNHESYNDRYTGEDEELEIPDMEDEELEALIKEMAADESMEDMSLTDEEMDEAIRTLEEELVVDDELEFDENELVDTEIDNSEIDNNETDTIDSQKASVFAEYLLNHEAEEFTNNNGEVNTNKLIDAVLDRLKLGDDVDIEPLYDIVQKVISKFEAEASKYDDEDLDENRARQSSSTSTSNKHIPSDYYKGDKDLDENRARQSSSTSTSNKHIPSDYYKESFEAVNEDFKTLKSLVSTLIKENKELKNINKESGERLDEIKNKLYEATIASRKTASVNELFLNHNNLNSRDKQRILENFIKLDTVKDIKNTFDTLNEEFSKKSIVNESISDKITTTTMLSTPSELKTPMLNESTKLTGIDRMLQLSGLKPKQ
jgi:hypothetical protein